jgi:hypothetical protein
LRAANIDLHAEAEELAANNGILFLEGIQTVQSREEEETLFDAVVSLDEADTARAIADLDRVSAADHSNTEVMRQVAGTGVYVAFPDHRRDGEAGTDKTLTGRKADLDRRMAEAENTKTMQANNTWVATNLGYTIYRNRYLTGRMGSHLAQQYPTGRIEEDIHAKLVAGNNHATIGEDLGTMGVRVGHRGENESDLPPYTRNFVRSVSRVAITANERELFLKP